jgi:hypothetical protein
MAHSPSQEREKSVVARGYVISRSGAGTHKKNIYFWKEESFLLHLHLTSMVSTNKKLDEISRILGEISIICG